MGSKIAVIGGGSAGVMATLRAVLNNDEVLLFPGAPKDRKRSREMWVTKIENMPDYPQYKKGIVDPNKSTINWILESDFKDNLELFKNTGIVKINKEGKVFTLEDSKGQNHQADYVVLCTGVMDVQPEINGSIEPILPFANKQSADYCLRCDGHHSLNKDTSVIGYGDGAAWVSIMLYERYKNPTMTILTHGKKPEFSERTQELIEKYKIKVIEDEIVEVLGDKKAGLLEGYKFKNGESVKTNFTFISLGMIVYNELALKLGAKVDDRGFVITDEKGQSSIENLYIAGDLRAGIKNQVYTAWDSAVDSLDAINGKIRQFNRS